MTLPGRAAAMFSKRGVLGAHLVLVGLMIVWRALDAVPALSPERGSRFFESKPMELLAVLSILAAVVAAFVVVIGSLRTWRDWQTMLLLALFIGSMWRRRGPVDALDIAYAVVALFLCAHFFLRVRPRAV